MTQWPYFPIHTRSPQPKRRCVCLSPNVGLSDIDEFSESENREADTTRYSSLSFESGKRSKAPIRKWLSSVSDILVRLVGAASVFIFGVNGLHCNISSANSRIPLEENQIYHPKHWLFQRRNFWIAPISIPKWNKASTPPERIEWKRISAMGILFDRAANFNVVATKFLIFPGESLIHYQDRN